MKRRLAHCTAIINFTVEIAPHPHNSTRQIATKIQEGPLMTYTLSKRIFERHPLRDRNAMDVETGSTGATVEKECGNEWEATRGWEEGRKGEAVLQLT